MIGCRDVLDAIEQLQGGPEEGTGNDAAGDAEEKRRTESIDGKAVSLDCAERESEDQQRRRIVQQAFALEDREDAMRWLQLTEHGSGGNGVEAEPRRRRGQQRAPTASPARARGRRPPRRESSVRPRRRPGR